MTDRPDPMPDADAWSHVQRACNGYRPGDVVPTRIRPYAYRLDVVVADAVVDVTRGIGGTWHADAWQDGADGAREKITEVRTDYADAVRVVVVGAVAACDALRWDLDDVDGDA